MTAHRQERGLKNKAEANGEKIKPHWPKNPAAHLQNRVRNRDEKTDRRENEKISIHRECSILDIALSLAMSASARNSARPAVASRAGGLIRLRDPVR
jgi:hypothetical protein